MTFAVDDLVKVVKKNVLYSHWVKALDKYVGDGNVYEVVDIESHAYSDEAEIRVRVSSGELWWFPESSLELVKEYSNQATEELLKSITSSFYYKGEHLLKDMLAKKLVNEAAARFNSNAQEDALDILINELNIVKEVCQKLK